MGQITGQIIEFKYALGDRVQLIVAKEAGDFFIITLIAGVMGNAYIISRGLETTEVKECEIELVQNKHPKKAGF